MRAATVVVAPDSFKGSLSSPAAARTVASGVRAALGAETRVVELPLADGGEGTLDALVAAWGGTIVSAPTTDALGRPREARIGFSREGRRAIIEAAEANGLPLVSDRALCPLDADSAGVGMLVRAALDRGAEELLLCVGGSATSDGGAGMLRALGARLLDAAGTPVPPGARGLAALEGVDLSAVPHDVRAARWRIACDVTNPLTGPRGAAAVFGPQKGATAADVAVIDAGLTRLAEALVRATASQQPIERTVERWCDQPGVGAAGGLPLAPTMLWGAELVAGADLVARAVGLDDALASADLVITGEGRLDEQSLHGKAVSRVLGSLAAATPATLGRPACIVLAGSVALTSDACRRAGITAALSLAPGPASLGDLRAGAAQLLAETAAHACALWSAGR